jgi:hypothetical protein
LNNSSKGTRKVIVKMMTVNRTAEQVFDFFKDVKKSMEAGGAARSVTICSDGWWSFDHIAGARAKIKHTCLDRKAGVMDHVFVSAGIEWHAYVRIVPNQDGATMTWLFMRPDGLSDEEFEKQLFGFDKEILLWQDALENHQTS